MTFYKEFSSLKRIDPYRNDFARRIRQMKCWFLCEEAASGFFQAPVLGVPKNSCFGSGYPFLFMVLELTGFKSQMNSAFYCFHLTFEITVHENSLK